jgi:hypothetical protein
VHELSDEVALAIVQAVRMPSKSAKKVQRIDNNSRPNAIAID